MVSWPLAQLLIEFVAAPANGFWMQARDLCDLLQPAMSDPLGLTARDPTTLLLVQATEQSIELPMLRSFRMFPRPACRTTTLVNRQFRRHSPTSFPGVAGGETRQSISRNSSWSGSKRRARIAS